MQARLLCLINAYIPSLNGSAHVVTTRREYKDKTYVTHLLRRSYREDGKVKNETLRKLSHLPEELIGIIRRSLQGKSFVPASAAIEILRSRAHGHVKAVALAMQRLGLASVIASQPSRERDLVLAMVASRILSPDPKLATSSANRGGFTSAATPICTKASTGPPSTTFRP